MSKKSNPVTVGAFLIGAITLGIVGITIFGSGRFFRETYKFILYFESDVSGLSEGANVKLKGVQIGTVKSVLLSAGDMSALSGAGGKFYVPVIIEIDADKTKSLGATAKPDPATIADLVKRGMRGQLASESIVTGVHYVKLDFFPGTRGLRLGDQVNSSYPEIPTLPTQLEEVQIKAAKFIANLEQIDLKGLVEEMKGAVVSARQILDSPDVRAAVEHIDDLMTEADATLISLRATSNTTREALDPLRKQLDATLTEFRATLVDVRSAAVNAGALVDPNSPLMVALEGALDDAAGTARTFKDLAAMLERQPDALIRGKGTPKVTP